MSTDRVDVPCGVADCDRKRYGRGWCNMHYQRWKVHGDPLTKNSLRCVPLAERFETRVDRSGGPTACHPWTGPVGRGGYGTLSVESRGRLAHRVAWFLEHGAWPVEDLLHECDNPPCCNLLHLHEGDHLANMREMAARGRNRQPKGEAHHRARMTDELVVELRELRKSGWILRDLAARYGISTAHVSNIAAGKTWRHL